MKTPGRKVNSLMERALQDAPSGAPEPGHKTSKAYKAIWYSVVQDFPADYFRPSDMYVLDMFCTLTLEVQELLRIVERDGRITPEGKAHPAYLTINQLVGRIDKLRASIRMQPSSRYDQAHVIKRPTKAVTVDQTGEDDEWRPRLAQLPK